MADRSFVESWWLLKYTVTLAPLVTFQGSSAPNLQQRQFSAAGSGSATPKYSTVNAPTTGAVVNPYVVGDGYGTRSITRNSTGNYTFVLSDSYLYLIQISVQFANSGASFNAPIMVVDSATSNTNVALNTAPGNGGKITIQFYNGSGVGTDPAASEQGQFIIVLGNSGAP